MAKKIEIISREALQTLRPEIMKALEKVTKKYGVAFDVTKGHFTNGNTGDFKLEMVVAGGKAGKSAADILGADNWKTYAKSFGLNPKLLGKTFEYKGVECTIKGIEPTRRKFPVQVDMGGKAKLFPVETVMLYTDPKALAAHEKRIAGWQRPNARMHGRI